MRNDGVLDPTGERFDLLALGASAGGIAALRDLLGRIDLAPSAVAALTVHRSPVHNGHLAQVLARSSALPLHDAREGERAAPGCVYLAPRDQHLLLEKGRWRLERGPREHHVRPAIDPLFRSVAAGCGPRAVGVLLSGGGEDGTAGLIAIAEAGGLVLVQDPEEAQHGWMPRSALRRDHVHGVLRIDAMARALSDLTHGRSVMLPSPDALSA